MYPEVKPNVECKKCYSLGHTSNQCKKLSDVRKMSLHHDAKIADSSKELRTLISTSLKKKKSKKGRKAKEEEEDSSSDEEG